MIVILAAGILLTSGTAHALFQTIVKPSTVSGGTSFARVIDPTRDFGHGNSSALWLYSADTTKIQDQINRYKIVYGAGILAHAAMNVVWVRK